MEIKMSCINRAITSKPIHSVARRNEGKSSNRKVNGNEENDENDEDIDNDSNNEKIKQ